MPSFMARARADLNSWRDLATTTTSPSAAAPIWRDLTTPTTSSPRGDTDLTTPTTSPRRTSARHRFDDSYHLTERTAHRFDDSYNLTNAHARTARRHTNNSAEPAVAPASIYKSMDYNRELRRRHSLQDLVQTVLRRLKSMVYNDLTSLTCGVDLDLRSRRFGSDLST
jgi:hypothetical protein